MNYKSTATRLDDYRRQIADLRRKMREAQASIKPEPVKEYEFRRAGGTVKLSELFGHQDTLIVVHNMGASCPYCTLWADGFNGLLPHIENRAAFAVASPDDPQAQEKFKASR